MRKYFKGINSKASDGWMLAVVSGCSNIDNEDWIIDTNSLHADQVPAVCADAKTFSRFVAGILNCYFNNIETKGVPEFNMLCNGTVEKEEEIPSPKNTEIPF